MNEMWKQLIEQFEEKGYSPVDIEYRVMAYDIISGAIEQTNKFIEDEKKNECVNRD